MDACDACSSLVSPSLCNTRTADALAAEWDLQSGPAIEAEPGGGGFGPLIQ